MKPIEARITPQTGADIRAAPGSGGAAHRLPPVVLCGVALLLSADLVSATDIGASSFRCITKMTPVRQFYVDNLQGNLDATLAAANSKAGAVYPPGSVIQLITGEAMVKRDRGFNAATHDWEFFELDVSKDGTQIRKRGTTDVINRFGGNCFDCHVPAAAQWDLVGRPSFANLCSIFRHVELEELPIMRCSVEAPVALDHGLARNQLNDGSR